MHPEIRDRKGGREGAGARRDKQRKLTAVAFEGLVTNQGTTELHSETGGWRAQKSSFMGNRSRGAGFQNAARAGTRCPQQKGDR